jgi:membrane peptidoglycan carboxypeptidase
MNSTTPILRSRRTRRLAKLRKGDERSRGAILSVGMILSLLIAAFILVTALTYANLTRDLPSVEILPRLLNPPDGLLLQPTRIYDRSGQNLLVTFAPDQSPRGYLPLNEKNPQHIPAALAEAVVAVADPGFWKHSGYALDGWQDPSLHPTLAQRLVSDLLLFDEPPSLRRSIRERILAAQITAQYGRPQILEWYLNSADFGHYAFGVEAASQLYFGKSAGELDLAEAAILAGVSQSPSLNPLDAPQSALQRGSEIIADLKKRGIISAEEAIQAIAAPIRIEPAQPSTPQPAEAFVNLVLAQLDSRFNRARIERGGLTIFTTLDFSLQQNAACVTAVYAARIEGLPDPATPCDAARLLPSLPAGTALTDASSSALILDPMTGQVLALVGETLKAQETPLITAHSPGSLLTPFIYLTGFTRGLSPASLVWDIPGQVDVQNYDGRYHGPLRLRNALANDYRVPAETVMRQMGAENVTKIAASFGLPLDAPLRLLEVAGAYGAFGTQGVYYGQALGEAFEPVTILRVESADHAVWLDWSVPEARPVVSPGLAYLVTSSLSDEAARWPSLGNPNAFEIGRPVGAKLGQTSNGQDVWALGYTPTRVVATWTGIRANEQRVSPRLPTDLWNALMQLASQDQPRDGWPIPPGVSVMDVCDPSGMLPTTDCPRVVSEVFLNGSEPTQADTLYRAYQVNRETGFLATVFTPPQFVEKRVYMSVPSEAKTWAQNAGLPAPPDSYDAIQPPLVKADVNITAPALFANVNGVVKIVGTASGADFAYYRVQVGQGLNPQAWVQVGADGSVPVENGLLVDWDTSGLSGLYAVQLVVVHTDQRVETAVIQVTVNQP